MLAKTRSSFQPKEAHHLEETGLSLSLVLDLILKYTYFEGAMTLAKLMERSKLSSTIIHAMYRHLQKEQFCDTRAMVGDDYEISLSNKGRNMAEVALKKSHYAGPAPVPLADYKESVSAQAAEIRLNRGEPSGRAERSGPSRKCDPGARRRADDGRSDHALRLHRQRQDQYRGTPARHLRRRSYLTCRTPSKWPARSSRFTIR